MKRIISLFLVITILVVPMVLVSADANATNPFHLDFVEDSSGNIAVTMSAYGDLEIRGFSFRFTFDATKMSIATKAYVDSPYVANAEIFNGASYTDYITIHEDTFNSWLPGTISGKYHNTNPRNSSIQVGFVAPSTALYVVTGGVKVTKFATVYLKRISDSVSVSDFTATAVASVSNIDNGGVSITAITASYTKDDGDEATIGVDEKYENGTGVTGADTKTVTWNGVAKDAADLEAEDYGSYLTFQGTSDHFDTSAVGVNEVGIYVGKLKLPALSSVSNKYTDAADGVRLVNDRYFIVLANLQAMDESLKGRTIVIQPYKIVDGIEDTLEGSAVTLVLN